MKRALSIILALVLAFGAVAATGLSATAEETDSLEKVELTVEGFEFGKAAANVKVIVPDGAKYEVYSTKCGKVATDFIGYYNFEGTFSASDVYELMITLKATSDSVNFYYAEILVNGKEPYSLDFYGSEMCYISVLLADKEILEVEQFQVDGVTDPVVGAAPVVAGITVPEDAKYEIKSLRWVENAELDLPSVTSFENGKEYYLEIQLQPKDGYVFSGRNEHCAVDGNSVVCLSSSPTGHVFFARYSLLKKITKVEITDYTEPKAGEAADMQVTFSGEGVDAENSCIYWEDNDWNEITTIGDKGLYSAVFEMYPLEGYEFADVVEVTLNGEKVNVYSANDDCWFYKDYPFGYQMIDRADITVAEVKEGQKPADVKVTLPEGVQLWEDEPVLWAQMKDGEVVKVLDLEKDTFKKGEKYACYIQTEAKDGYYFADDVKVTVNGKEIPELGEELATGFVVNGEYLDLYVVDVEAAQQPAAPTTPTTPTTGDNTPVGLLVTVMVLSAVMLVVLPIAFDRKERF